MIRVYVVIPADVLGFGGAFVCALLLAIWSLFRISVSVSVSLVPSLLLLLLFSSVLSHCHHHRLQFLFSSLFLYFSLCPILPLWYSLFCAIASVFFLFR
jgi:hypothetical protein